jgi:hypothetical protein
MRSVVLRVSLQQDELDYIQRLAKKAGMTMSRFIRREIGFETPMPELRGGVRPGQGRPRKKRPEQMTIDDTIAKAAPPESGSTLAPAKQVG